MVRRMFSPVLRGASGDDVLPDFPEDGFWHYGPEATFEMSRALGSLGHPEIMTIRVRLGSCRSGCDRTGAGHAHHRGWH
jgi:hypothetical protein